MCEVGKWGQAEEEVLVEKFTLEWGWAVDGEMGLV